MDDSDQWTAFAPIAKLESLDELDQVSNAHKFSTFQTIYIFNKFFPPFRIANIPII